MLLVLGLGVLGPARQWTIHFLRCARSGENPVALIYWYQRIVSLSFSCAIPRCYGVVFGCASVMLC
jgi:hypothetical protein